MTTTPAIVDVVTTIDDIHAAEMVAAGVKGCVLYADRTIPTSKQHVLNAGLELASVYETSGHSGKLGATGGELEARAHIAHHVANNGPHNVLLWLSPFDYAVQPSELTVAQRYIDAAQKVFHGEGYRGGFYGPAGLGQSAHGWDSWWQTESTSYWNNRPAWSGATLVQRTDLYRTYNGLGLDGNLLQPGSNKLTDWGSWTAPTPQPTPPAHPPLEAEMILVPRRAVPTIPQPGDGGGRDAFIALKPDTKQLLAYNGLDFLRTGSAWDVVTFGPSLVVATLKVAVNGEIDFGESQDGTCALIVGKGDGGTFALPYTKVAPEPPANVPAAINYTDIANHLSVQQTATVTAK